MNTRKYPLINGQYYHIINRSIAGFKIFNSESDFDRMANMLDVYRYIDFDYKYSRFTDLEPTLQLEILATLKQSSQLYAEIVAYCIMPTHIHLLLKQSSENGTTKYMAKVLNSYSRYFNTTHKRVGPLWSGHFKNVPVNNDEQLLHLTRYIHLNPVSAGLIEKPENWQHSSYRRYITESSDEDFLSDFHQLLDITPKSYQKFVNDQKSYQRDLAIIKHQLIEDYTG